ncbi:MAG: EAL domain-containing protein [Acidimicrobiales bacterium]
MALAVFSAVVLSGSPTPRGAVIISNLGQCTAPLLAALALRAASRRAQDLAQRRALRYLGVSALCWGLGQVIWTYYEISQTAAPFPSAADVGYVLAIPFAFTGVWMLSTRSTTSAHVLAAIDGLIVAGSLLAISWPLVLGPSWDAGGDSPLTFALSLAYPLGALVVSSSVLMVIMRAGGQRSAVPIALIGAGLLTLGCADSLFVWQTLQGTETNVSLADVGWVSGYLLIFLAATRYPRGADEELSAEKVVLRDQAASWRRALLPSSVAVLAIAVRIVMEVQGKPGDGFLTTITLTTIGLGIVRHLLTMRENQGLTRTLEEKIDELTTREGQLSHQAFHDPLTGLANRRLFSDRVDHALSRARRTGERTGVLFIDLDDFKVVNDSLGHAAGDRLLAAVGARLTRCVRPGDTVARLGGDEFGVLLEDLEGSAQATAVANRVLAALDVPFPVAGRQVFTRASIGMAVPSESEHPDGAQLLADADVALYAAKAAGKSTYRRFETEMRLSAVARLELGQDLRRAIQSHEFVCNYQPIVDLVTGRIVAIEALVRWDHPNRGLLEPAAFIEMAEETGAIGQIGRHVLEVATAQAAGWRTDGATPMDLELHVNLSGRQLESPDLVDEVRLALARTGFPGSLLVLEITESVAVEVADQHIDRLLALQDLGIRLAIDDFGTGYSSLNYLRTLPVDVLKIDRAFAKTLGDQTDQVLLEAIVKLGHSLGIEVIAEGIERDEQAAALRRMGCRLAQGYLFFRPVDAAGVPALLAGGPLAAPDPDATPDPTPSPDPTPTPAPVAD